MVESNGVNTSRLTNNYSYFPTDSTYFFKESDMVALTRGAESITTCKRTLTWHTQAEDGFDLRRGLVLNIFKEQGMDLVVATGESMVDPSSLSQEEAQESIAEDGDFGVEKTSERIFQYATAVAGGDPAGLDAIGGWLPDTSCDTCDAVASKLDDWAGASTSQTIGK